MASVGQGSYKEQQSDMIDLCERLKFEIREVVVEVDAPKVGGCFTSFIVHVYCCCFNACFFSICNFKNAGF